MASPAARRAFICGLSGFDLTAEEARFLKKNVPSGMIIFARNVENPAQVRQLIADARQASHAGNNFLVLIDQEGGRVQRLSAPHWRRYPAAVNFEKACGGNVKRAAQSAAACGRLIAQDLWALGINVSCAPVLDIPAPGAHNVIGDRAYACDPETVALIGGAVADALLAGGVLPVMKHIPGHGRAMADSHFALPVIETPLAMLETIDFAPFRALRHLPVAMTAHLILTAVDAALPVTVSKRAISQIIRGSIGFDGLLMTDDLSMKALSGSLENRTRAAFEAGCDIALHCNGNMNEMESVAAASPVIEGDSLRRFERALTQLKTPQPFDLAEAEKALAATMLIS